MAENNLINYINIHKSAKNQLLIQNPFPTAKSPT